MKYIRDKAIVATESGASNNNRGIYFEETDVNEKGDILLLMIEKG